jgi:CRISPR-associated protein Cmr5
MSTTNKKRGPTLEQQRAAFAWKQAIEARTVLGEGYDGYVNLIKGAPALVMNSGLMATLAYYRSRTGSNSPAARRLLDDLGLWLHERGMGSRDFGVLMQGLFDSDPLAYRRATAEMLAFLKWLRHFAAAVN